MLTPQEIQLALRMLPKKDDKLLVLSDMVVDLDDMYKKVLKRIENYMKVWTKETVSRRTLLLPMLYNYPFPNPYSIEATRKDYWFIPSKLEINEDPDYKSIKKHKKYEYCCKENHVRYLYKRFLTGHQVPEEIKTKVMSSAIGEVILGVLI